MESGAGMTRKRRPDIAPSAYEIRVGMLSNFVVVRLGAAHDFDPVAAFDSLRAAMDHFPSAKISEGAVRKAQELGG
jgi:hypothetical protein